MGGLDYVEPSKDEVVDLALKKNKGVVKMVLEDRHEESDCEEASNMIKSSSISFGDLQGEEIVVRMKMSRETKSFI